MKSDHVSELMNELEALDSRDVKGFCEGWEEKWRGLAIAAQSILNIFFPPGAKVLGVLITIANSVCEEK